MSIPPTSTPPLHPVPDLEKMLSELPTALFDDGDDGDYLPISQDCSDRSDGRLPGCITLKSSQDLATEFAKSEAETGDKVRCLILAENGGPWIEQSTFTNIPTSLCNHVESLEFCHLNRPRFDEWSLTDGLKKNLTSLVLQNVRTDRNMLRSFICTLPNLDNLVLDRISWLGDGILSPEKPPIAPRFKGKLALQGIRCDGGENCLFAHLKPMPLSDLSVVNCDFQSPESLRDLFLTCGGTVKRVKLCDIDFPIPDATSDTPLVDLSLFTCLEEVELELTLLNYSVDRTERVLQNITSNLVHKITLNFIPAKAILREDLEIDFSIWSRLNTTFMKMANRLDGADKALEVVFHFEAQGWEFKDTVRFERKQVPQDLDNMNPDLGDLLPVMKNFLISRAAVETYIPGGLYSSTVVFVGPVPTPSTGADRLCEAIQALSV